MMGWLSFLQQAPARLKLGGEGGWERSRGFWCVLRLVLLMIASQINKSESSNMPPQPLLWAGSWRACVANAFSNAGGKPSLLWERSLQGAAKPGWLPQPSEWWGRTPVHTLLLQECPQSREQQQQGRNNVWVWDPLSFVNAFRGCRQTEFSQSTFKF